jgi:hypothetical protein
MTLGGWMDGRMIDGWMGMRHQSLAMRHQSLACVANLCDFCLPVIILLLHAINRWLHVSNPRILESALNLC